MLPQSQIDLEEVKTHLGQKELEIMLLQKTIKLQQEEIKKLQQELEKGKGGN